MELSSAEIGVEVTVADADCLKALQALCAEFGIVVEVREP